MCGWCTARRPTRPPTAASASPSAISRPPSISSRAPTAPPWCAAPTASTISSRSRVPSTTCRTICWRCTAGSPSAPRRSSTAAPGSAISTTPERSGASGAGGAVKTYIGGRSLAGAEVTVDGRKLDPRFDLKRLSPAGFEWTYEGNGPAQLALALLADHLGDDRRALALHERFMRHVIADLDNSWELTSADIDAALGEIGG